ncbi:MAG TPA: hopanoid C-3 methylase HpnR [Acidimicrobiales bacterium]|nr:hopanoid C-3 methylase HpnR [Acidimicrobiales bacterium]
MRILLVHPSALMYSELYLRLEPLGLERVASSLLAEGHEVRMVDLQVYGHPDYFAALADFRPDAVGMSLNYLANVPEVVDLAKKTKAVAPRCKVFVGGHSVSFIASHVLSHGEGAIDAVLRGEGESGAPPLVQALLDGGLDTVAGAVGLDTVGPSQETVHSIDDYIPARHIGGRRRKYFIGVLDPCASIEFSRGCPWDCSFCSAWTFYGRSYRQVSPEAAAEDLARVPEPGVFLVDDVAFIKPEHGMAIAHEVERRGIKKEYYLETRTDVLVRHPEVFAYWKRLGLNYMFLGLEAIDEEGLKAFRKRSTTDVNARALQVARDLGLSVAVNLIVDPAWDETRFATVREWAMSVPEIVHLTVQTPYPGTETWHSEARQLTTRDYRLFDIQHAVLPTTLPLPRFYEELVKTQSILAKKHLGVSALAQTLGIVARHLAHGQTNFLKMIWNFSRVYNPERQLADHRLDVDYELPEPPATPEKAPDRSSLYVHVPVRRRQKVSAGEGAAAAAGDGTAGGDGVSGATGTSR